MSRPRRVLGYARVSSEEQARGTSLADQQAAIAAYAQAQGLRVTQFYVEAESGIREKTERRQQMQALLRDVKKGDLVLVDKIDRWSRDPEFTYGSVRRILACGASFYAVGENIDASTSEGDSALGFRILFAREEHKRIRQRMIGTRHLLRDKGYWIEGVVCFGYRRPPGVKGLEKNILQIVPEEAEVVRKAFRMAIAGRGFSDIVTTTGIPLDRVKTMLARRMYVGEMTNSKGEWIKGRHPAIVDADTFERARKAIDGRRWSPAAGAPTRTDDWILRDVAVCGLCGAKMGSAYGTNDTVYYRCVRKCSARGPQMNSGSYVEVRSIETVAAEMILTRLREMRATWGRPGPKAETELPDFDAQRAKLEQRRRRLVDAFEMGTITVAELRERHGKLDEERLRIDAEQVRVTKPALTARARREALRELSVIEDAWRRADGKRRRLIVRELVVQARLLPRAVPTLIWREAEDLVAEE